MRRLLFATLFLSSAISAHATPADDLHGVLTDHWAWFLKTNPVYASALGVHTYDDQLPDFSLEEQDRQALQAGEFVRRLEAIPVAELSAEDQTNRAILKRILSEQIEANGFGERMITIAYANNWFQNFADIPDQIPFQSEADYVNYLTRLSHIPQANGQELAITRRAISEGYVAPCVALPGIGATITGVISNDPTYSRFYAPFKKPKPAGLAASRWSALQAQAQALITQTLNPEYRKLDVFYKTEYLPRCRASYGTAALPDGKRYYSFLIRQQTTTDLSAEQIHDLGLAEVKRIRSEMDALSVKAGYASREDFIHDLRTNPKYYPKSAEELLGAAALQAKRNDGKMPGLFATLPRLPYGVREIAAETAATNTAAFYQQGSAAAGIAGTFYINTSALEQRPLYELPALVSHEAVPGHHNQIALQQELPLPDFRRYDTFFTAFVEGWGLYAEHLGIEMGIYDTPAKDMGRLSYEMWRACRLVVDTGLHAQGWTKDQAVAFMKENTALTDKNIDAEVNRYITTPGQALAYKLGELRILALRSHAETELGSAFDVRQFHDALLGQGPVPLDLLDSQIDRWITLQKRGGASRPAPG